MGGADLTSYVRDPGVWEVREGYIALMEGVGLGIEVDEREVRERAVGAEAWVSLGFGMGGPGGEVREW